MKKIDARGCACPKPVVMARDAVVSGCSIFAIEVDNDVSASNVTRFLGNQGYEVTRADAEGGIVLTAQRSETAPSATHAETSAGDYAVLLLSQQMGDESAELGELLMKSFLGTLLQRDGLPSAVALMNGGVKLALPNSTVSDTLRDMETRGVVVLVCGTCTKHFGITEEIVVGQISNMFEIVETVFGSPKPIVIG